MLRLYNFNPKYLFSSNFNRCLNNRGKKYPITKHQSVSSLSMLKFLWWSVANVFFSPAFVKTAYPFWSLVFLPYVVCGCPLCIVWFPALSWIQLLFHTEDSWFWIAYIGLIKPGEKKKKATHQQWNIWIHLVRCGNVTIVWTSGQEGNCHQSVWQIDLPLL